MKKINDNSLEGVTGGFSTEEIEWAKSVFETPKIISACEATYKCRSCDNLCNVSENGSGFCYCQNCRQRAEKILRESGITQWEATVKPILPEYSDPWSC